MGCVRINTKGICYTVTFFLFCYSWVILVGQYKKKLTEQIFKILIGISWMDCIKYFSNDTWTSKISKIGECSYAGVSLK